MARKSKKIQQAIDLKMYRHFAVATVAITALLAIFADGGNRQAVADSTAYAVKIAETAELSGIKLREPEKSDSASNYSDPGEGTSYYDNSRYDRTRLRRAGVPPWVEKLKLLGLTLAQFQALPKDEQAAILEILNARPSGRDEAAMIRATSNASLDRSGGGEGADM